MQTNIQRWGNSLGLRIPIHLAKQLHLHPGSQVTLEVENGKLIVQTPQYNLEDMVKGITSKNKHNLLLDSSQMGNEEW